MPIVCCSVIVDHGSGNLRQCSYRARVWRNGIAYCGRHDPERARLKALRIATDRLRVARAYFQRLKDDPQEAIRVVLEQAERGVRAVEVEIMNLEAQAPVDRQMLTHPRGGDGSTM